MYSDLYFTAISVLKSPIQLLLRMNVALILQCMHVCGALCGFYDVLSLSIYNDHAQNDLYLNVTFNCAY